MKKFFTLFLAVFGMTCAANAQSFEFQLDGQSLPDGSTITIEAETDPWTGGMICNTNPSDNTDRLLFKNLTVDESITEGSATIEILENTMGAEVISWCMGGTCKPIMGTTYTKNFSFANATNNAIQPQYDAEPAHFGEMLTKMVATIDGQDYTINIRFSYADPASISGVAEDKATIVGYYTIDGRQLQAPRHGVNIVKLSNGKTVKQIINN